MNSFSRQGLIAFLAAAVTTTSVAKRPSECDGQYPLMLCLELCDFPGNFPIEPRGNSSRVPQFTGGYQFWIDGNKNETLHASNPRGLIEM